MRANSEKTICLVEDNTTIGEMIGEVVGVHDIDAGQLLRVLKLSLVMVCDYHLVLVRLVGVMVGVVVAVAELIH